MLEKYNSLHEVIQRIVDVQNQFKKNILLIENTVRKTFVDSGLYDSIREIANLRDRLINHPEYQFGFISDLEVLNLNSTEELKESLTTDLPDQYIIEKEEIINQNLLPYLERLELDALWLGANYALASKENPDKIRHCLVSLRTILEYLIEMKLAPKEELKNNEMFIKEFKDYNSGKEKIEYVRIKREKRIEYFTSKIDFGILEEFTKKDINYICDCYSVLCNIHNPKIDISENQVRSLKVKTGITIWLLAYIYEVINQ